MAERSVNRFVVIAPAFNTTKTLRQFMLSLAVQTYDRWNLVLVDDMSVDGTANFAWDIAKQFGISKKVHVIRNTEKLWETANVLKGIHEGHTFDDNVVMPIGDDAIICRIDPDDYLCDVDAFQVLDLAYDRMGYDIAWTMHRWFDDKRITQNNISHALPNGCNPYTTPWCSSHLKTFRKRLINGINDANFRGADGDYIKRAGDQALYLPLLHVARNRGFLPLVTYAYRCNMDPETFQTDDAKFQAAEAEFLRARGFVP